MEETKKKEHLNVVIIDHVDAGKYSQDTPILMATYVFLHMYKDHQLFQINKFPKILV